ncbi:hypothetical protein ADUPG1_000433 [Aduncisulcus paluster]|uniref:Peptidase A2 domain-containing protein n=1 Tax=Aduncisulcus paluster TaxID=2918883 RepID=A0ABQ5K6C4_9EUKA|nr:hypothetical protein ADUPG1_000433 [Aduncisulcus paluster]
MGRTIISDHIARLTIYILLSMFNARFLSVYDSAPELAQLRATTVAKIYAKAITIHKLRSPFFQLIDDGVSDIAAQDPCQKGNTHYRHKKDVRSQKTKRSTSDDKKPLKCSHCGKLYHDIDHCFILHPELRTKKLSSTRGSDSFRVPVTLQGGIETTALIDTGSDCNIIHPNLLENDNLEITLHKCDHSVHHGKDSVEQVKKAGEIDITFTSSIGKLCTALIQLLGYTSVFYQKRGLYMQQHLY